MGFSLNHVVNGGVVNSWEDEGEGGKGGGGKKVLFLINGLWV